MVGVGPNPGAAARRGRVPAAYLREAAGRGLDARIYTDIDAMLEELGSAGVIEALVEARPTVTKRFVDLGLCDEQVIMRQSPKAGGAGTFQVIRPPRT
jgi:riboflavin biosynthesis pyrimidine reductase